ncbi:hypothetical protein evm_007118 [Chilo suppressalis]|nr:hypothetical protein evm_007118 [Chilo suppressalis]
MHRQNIASSRKDGADDNVGIGSVFVANVFDIMNYCNTRDFRSMDGIVVPQIYSIQKDLGYVLSSSAH